MTSRELPPSYSELKTADTMNNDLVDRSEKPCLLEEYLQNSYTAGPDSVIMMCRKRNRTSSGFSGRTHRRRLLCIAQVVIGISCVAFNATVVDVVAREVGAMGFGVWDGALFIMTGTFGLATARTKMKHLDLAFMLLCIISAVVSGAILSLGVLGVIILKYDCSFSHLRYFQLEWICPENYSPHLAMNLFVTGLAALETIIAAWSSVLCYKTVCYGSASTDSTPKSVQMISVNDMDHVIIVTSSSSLSHYTISTSGADLKVSSKLSTNQKKKTLDVSASAPALLPAVPSNNITTQPNMVISEHKDTTKLSAQKLSPMLYTTNQGLHLIMDHKSLDTNK